MFRKTRTKLGLLTTRERLEDAMAAHDKLMSDTVELFHNIYLRTQAEMAPYNHIFERFEK